MTTCVDDGKGCGSLTCKAQKVNQSMHKSLIELHYLYYTASYIPHVAESEGASVTFATENITILEQAFINARNG